MSGVECVCALDVGLRCVGGWSVRGIREHHRLGAVGQSVIWLCLWHSLFMDAAIMRQFTFRLFSCISYRCTNTYIYFCKNFLRFGTFRLFIYLFNTLCL